MVKVPKERLNKAFNHRGTEDTEMDFTGLLSELCLSVVKSAFP